MGHCKKHESLTFIERVFVENFVTFEDGKPPSNSDDWTTDPIMWHNPQPVVIIVTCPDCGYERFFGPRAKMPKWVQSAWDELKKVQNRD